MPRLLILLLPLLLLGCAGHGPLRPQLGQVCTQAPPAPGQDRCAQAAFEQVTGPQGYYLGFVEFDDQGQPTVTEAEGGAPAQLRAVVGQANTLAGQGDVILVAFVHGWHHSAAAGDSNIDTLRTVLAGLAANEARRPANLRRPVIGVYVGWRGNSITLGGLNELTFWDRKNTAAKVGYGSVTQLFAELEQIKRSRDAIDGPAARPGRTRLVVVGHSFGGLVVHNALGQIMVDRAVRTEGGSQGYVGDIERFGDLVVLINPAFEAQAYAPLRQVAVQRKSYGCEQRPIEVILTSRSDDATKLAFPLGRLLSSMFQHGGWAPANTTAVGHYGPFLTHDLSPGAQTPPPPGPCTRPSLVARQSGAAGLNLSPWPRPAGSPDTPPRRDPYLNISVDGSLIKGHNDIGNAQTIEFLTGLLAGAVSD